MSVSRQYILITPNPIDGNAKVDKDVKIIQYVFPLLHNHLLVTPANSKC